MSVFTFSVRADAGIYPIADSQKHKIKKCILMFFMMLYGYYVAGKDEDYICINQHFVSRFGWFGK